MIKSHTKSFIVICCFILGFIGQNNTTAQILTKKYHLEGFWKFSIGDKQQWKNPTFDDSMWDQIKSGQDWESQGYNDYNGFAWYRKTLNIQSTPKKTLILKIGAIDDADQVYFNGTLIGKTGGFPPTPSTAYNQTREYKIPQHLWLNGANTIAIRVYDFYDRGGITSNPLAIYEDISADYLTMDLSGIWYFKTGNNSQFKSADFNHSNWEQINVPGKWEDQGWPYYDGIAWYRTNFYLSPDAKQNKMYLILGRIDDEDEVYFNGQKIGETKNKHSNWSTNAYRELRIYPIPDHLLNYNSTNTIAVKVKDDQLDGGIYEGPIGIATKEQADDLRSIFKQNKSSWETFLEWIYD
nr:beta galactosidase jelly roll domain-containing protein [uncultured Carboxylicivirga sp.]